MTLMMLLEMIVSAFGERIGLGSARGGLSYRQLYDRAGAGAQLLRHHGAAHLAYLGTNDDAFPVALFAAAWAGVPLLPLNYRLSEEDVRGLIEAHHDVVIIATDEALDRVGDLGVATFSAQEWNQACGQPASPEPPAADGDDIAVLLYTSGTTAEPKAVVLRHRHLAAYIIGSVTFGGAGEDESTLVSVPPYHVAGVATILSNLYAARRLVYLPQFSPQRWLDLVRDEAITHAMVVPTMLARVVNHLGDATQAATPTLRSLAYGGARMPVAVLEAAIELFDDADFVNAYGLTETSSTIAVLGPDDHRAAVASDRPHERARLGSVGRLIPGIEAEIRDPDGGSAPAGVAGEIWVRGDQVSGEYLGHGASLDAQGWFPTRDRGWLDEEGYLFIEGRADDTIIRGGENIAPAEIEDVLLTHPDVEQAAVVGVPDQEWGQRIGAVVVLGGHGPLTVEDLRDWARSRLRSSKTPEIIAFRDDLPVTETGKLLRRQVVADLASVATG